MDPKLTPLPAVEPTVLLVDSSPLIHLAMIGALDLPLRFGSVVVPDAIETETTHDLAKPFATEIHDWLAANMKVAGRNRWVDRPSTDVGELLRIAIETGRPRPRNVGEHAIVSWLADNLRHFGGPALIVYENGKVPNMLLREGLADDVVVVTSRTFLALAERAGFLASADSAWRIVATHDPRANPTLTEPTAGPDAERHDIVRRYVDREITAEEAADRLGPGTAIVDVILEAKRRFGRLPDRNDAFNENEYQRALVLLGLADHQAPAD